MSTENQTLLPAQECPVCKCTLDAHTTVFEEQVPPRPDDFSVCIQCAAILRFDQNLRLVECHDFFGVDENTQFNLRRVQQHIQARRQPPKKGQP